MRPRKSSGGDHRQVLDPVDALRRRIVDELVDTYVNWRDACGLVSAAYDHWNRARGAAESLAYRDYTAALNCEEDAAAVYQRAVERLTEISAPPGE